MKYILFDKYGNRYYYKDNFYYHSCYEDGNEYYFHLYQGCTQIHREDGPAVISYGNSYWYYYGKRLNCRTQEEFEKMIKLKAFW